MIRKRSFRSSIALAVAAVMLALTLGMPLLDVGSDPAGVAICDGDAHSGWVDHDHQQCRLYSAAHWAPTVPVAPPVDLVVRADPTPPPRTLRPVGASRTHHQPRAPPVV